MAIKSADEALQELLRYMYAIPDDFSEQHDEDSIMTYRQAISDVAFLWFPPSRWMQITGQTDNIKEEQ